MIINSIFEANSTDRRLKSGVLHFELVGAGCQAPTVFVGVLSLESAGGRENGRGSKIPLVTVGLGGLYRG
jgi:hypothetical protein